MYFYNKYHKQMMATANLDVRFALFKCNAAWYRELYEFDVREHLENLDCPTLVIGGGNDAQSQVDYINEISELIPGAVESYLLPDMTHILRDSTVRCTMLNTFSVFKAVCKEPLSSELETRIQDWCQRI